MKAPFFLTGKLKYNTIIVSLLTILQSLGLYGQEEIIWEEDFNTYVNGTQHAPGKWETEFTDCDGIGTYGVQNGQFEVNEYEGSPCCTPAGGANYNLFETVSIDISSYCDVTFSVLTASSGNSPECETGGPFSVCTGNTQIDDFHDQIVIEYILDGGPITQAHYVCGGNELGQFTSQQINGTSLILRILPANKFGSETYIIDDILVTGQPASPVTLTIPQDSFLADEQSINLSTIQGDVTGSWSGPGVNNGNEFDPSLVGQGTYSLIFTPDSGQCAAISDTTVVVLPAKVILPPEQFTYQAVIRDSNSTIIRNTTIGLRLSVLRDSSTSTTPLYSETHNLTTTSSGLITTEIGGGMVQSGDFSSIMWGEGIYFIKTEIDINGGTDYGISGVTPVLSVPYALYSKRARYSESSSVALNALTSAYSDSARVTSYSQTSRVSIQSDSSIVSDKSNYSDSARVAWLLPRLTSSQRDSIQNPEQGLQIFNLTTRCLELNMGFPSNPVWFQIGCLGTVDSILCDSAVVSQGLTVKTPTNGRTVTIPYTDGNSYDYPQKVFQSQGVSGLTLSLLKGRVNSGDGNIVMEFSGTPQDTGTAVFLIDIATKSCSLEVSIAIGAGEISTLLCGRPKLSNAIYEGDTIESMSIKLPYLGGDGGYFIGDTIESTKVTGMIARIESGYLSIGDDSIQINISGVPSGNGIGYFPIAIGGQTCSLSIYVIDSSTAYYPTGYVHCDPLNPTEVVEVLNPTTGKIWMDRNLGASRVATSYNDAEAYGDWFQWGRFADGHQCRDSDTTSTNATTAVPNAGNVWDGKFILKTTSPDDWLIPQNNNLWQGVNGVNNPCPAGYRLPNEAEWDAERQSWGSNNSGGAFGSPLRLPVSGHRDGYNETYNVGENGLYWSSSLWLSSFPILLYFDVNEFGCYDGCIFPFSRTEGVNVRCIKD